jgi:hypothetical protein
VSLITSSERLERSPKTGREFEPKCGSRGDRRSSSFHDEYERDSYIISRPKEEGLHAKAASPPTLRSCAVADSTPISCTPGVCVSKAVWCRLLPAGAPNTFKPALRELIDAAYLNYGASAFLAPSDLPEAATAATKMSFDSFPTKNFQFVPYNGPLEPKPTQRCKHTKPMPSNHRECTALDESHPAGDELVLGRHHQSCHSSVLDD